MKLTKAAISGLTLDDGKKDAIFWDSDLPGFGVRIRSGGKKTFIVQYRVGRQQRRLTLGRIDALDLSEARRKARGALGKAGLGEDTQAAKAVARQVQAPFFRDLVKRFLERQQSRLRPKSYSETKRYLEQSWRSLHGERVDQVTRAIIAGRLTDMAKANGPVAADRARAAISAMFAWAMREGLAESNPAAMTNRHSDAKPGERTLSDAELAQIWHSSNEDDYGRIVRLLMLTGSRREEVAAMEWRELDLDIKLWVLPAARTKNHLGHEVPLCDGALAILGEVPRRDDRQLLFGQGEGPFSGWSQAKKRMDKRIAAACKEMGVGVPPHWTLHDLRRTVATRMAELGIAQPHIVEAVLNHISGHKAGVAGIYNRATYRDEKRRALEAWGAHVQAISLPQASSGRGQPV